ncbi:MAG: FHA domain-containing protein [Deltaproteobacteria bacterium]|nr:FHA domain-containing protein [Deltaproteobacteria bacterium]
MAIGLVCEHCKSLNPIDAQVCVVCGNRLVGSEQGESPRIEEKSMSANMIKCPQCGADVPEGFKFCGACGHKMDDPPAAAPGGAPAAKTLFFGAMQAPGRAKLILIKGQGQDGMTFYLSGTEHVAGRMEGDIRFPEPDPFLSPRHANFYYDNGKLFVRDEESTNGVFIRITEPVSLASGDTFLVGEQLLRVEKTRDEEAPSVDDFGTYFYGSPSFQAVFQVVQILHGGTVGRICRARGDKLTMGREGTDFNFPDDPFISGQHAQVEFVDGDHFVLTDHGSKNGTFLRVRQPRELLHGDYVFLGQQLLRVEIL